MREQNDQEELKKYFKIERPSCLSLLLERGGGGGGVATMATCRLELINYEVGG